MSDSRQYQSAAGGIVEHVMDNEQRYAAAVSKDARFDGMFFIAVTSTGVYCRPSCPAITPKRENMRFHRSAAAAQEAGFRACKRCRPDAAPGSPEWNVRADLVGRAMRLIADGVVDREGVGGLAHRLGYEQRQVRRLVTAELGAGPLALARAQRAQTARILTETTTLPLGEVAFAAGFASIRQFNATMLEVFDTTPTRLRDRAARSRHPATPPGVLRLRLAYRPPIDIGRMFGFLGERALGGVEEVTGGTYRRTIILPNGPGILSLRPGSLTKPAHVECELQLDDLRDLTAAVQRCRRLLDLDADPATVAGFFSADPVFGKLAAACPGRRVPGHVDGDELALRAVLGQQVSVAAARRLGARLVAEYGKPLSRPDGSLTHCFPAAATIAEADPATLPMPRARAAALTGLAGALASGDLSLDPGADRDRVTARLLALPGIGPWTASYIRMRGLSDPDAFLPGDVGVLEALTRLGAIPAVPGRAATARAAAARSAAKLAEAWHPWRSYAVHHLWATLEPPPAPVRLAPAKPHDRDKEAATP
jgi:AraC family transcriptional regulator, regulatory protein of adaptative response / DNA-3-methyladenine glycosylase II